MAISVSELREWLKGRDEGDEVAVDDGGLALVIVGDEEACIEVGGIPEEVEEEEEGETDR